MTDLKKYLEEFDLAIVSGGTSGIGAAFVRELFALNPMICVINLSRRKALVGGVELVNIHADFSSAESLDSCIIYLKEEISKRRKNGKILLINNAGVGDYDDFSDASQKRISEILDINVRAPLLITRALSDLICSSSGAILNVCSTAAFQPTPFMACYGASKAFLLNWSVALSAELGEKGCVVSALCPGPTDTNFFKSSGFNPEILPDKISGSAQKVAHFGLKLLVHRKVYGIVGVLNRILITLSGFVPLSLSGVLAKKAMLGARKKAHGNVEDA